MSELQVWDVATGKMLRQFQGHESRVDGIAFSPDGKLLASCGWDKSVRLWNVNDGKEAALLISEKDGKGIVEQVAFSPDGRYLAAAAQGPVLVWDVATRKHITTLKWEGYGPPRCLQFSPDSRVLAVGGQCRTLGLLKAGVVEIWETGIWKQRSIDVRPGLMILAVAISPDGTQLATTGFYGQVALGKLP